MRQKKEKPMQRTRWLLLMLALLVCLCGCGLSADAEEPGATQEPTTLDLRDSDISDVSNLLGRTELTFLDLRGNPVSIESFKALSAALPECEILWSVPVGGARFDSDTESITLSGLPEAAADILACFPNLKSVRIENIVSDDYAMLSEFCGQYPQIHFSWDVVLGDTIYPQNTVTLDLSGIEVTVTELETALAGLPDLRRVITDENGVFAIADQFAVAEEYPQLSFVWNVQLLDDLSVRSDVTELDLRDYTVEDSKAFSDRLVLLPDLTSLDMCGCGPTDDEMAAMRERYPSIKFIWLTRVSGWIIRTDIKGFSTGNKRKFPDGAGEFVSDNYAYGVITSDSLQNLKYCTDLVALDVGHCVKIGNIDFIADLPKLKYLIVSLCDIVDISPLAGQTDLEFLEIKYNYIEDLTPLQGMTKLRFLNCANNEISQIDMLFSLTSLERLWINCTHITDDQVAQLEAALPNTLIKASPTNPEYAESLWRKDNEGYLIMQKLFGLRAQHQGSVDTEG